MALIKPLIEQRNPRARTGAPRAVKKRSVTSTPKFYAEQALFRTRCGQMEGADGLVGVPYAPVVKNADSKKRRHDGQACEAPDCDEGVRSPAGLRLPIGK